jgi:hypothetical protein
MCNSYVLAFLRIHLHTNVDNLSRAHAAPALDVAQSGRKSLDSFITSRDVLQLRMHHVPAPSNR